VVCIGCMPGSRVDISDQRAIKKHRWARPPG
jgi:hypothetical protein